MAIASAAAASASRLSILPLEVRCEIFSYLRWHDINNVKRVFPDSVPWSMVGERRMTGKEEVSETIRTFDETPHPFFKKLNIRLDDTQRTDVEETELHLQSFIQQPVRVEHLLLTWRTRPQDVSLLIRRVRPICLVLDYDTLLRTSGARASYMRIMYAGHWTPDEFAIDDVNRLNVRYPSVECITVVGLPIRFTFHKDYPRIHWDCIVSSFLRICAHMFPNAKVITLESLLSGKRMEYACDFSWQQWKPIYDIPPPMWSATRITFREKKNEEAAAAPSISRPTTVCELVAGQREGEEGGPMVDKLMAWFMLKLACKNLPHLQIGECPPS